MEKHTRSRAACSDVRCSAESVYDCQFSRLYQSDEKQSANVSRAGISITGGVQYRWVYRRNVSATVYRFRIRKNSLPGCTRQ